MPSLIRRTLLAGMAASALAAGSALAQPAAPRVAVTHHAGVFNGQAVKYTATVSEHVLAGPSGAPAATAMTIAYVRDEVADRSKRPVMFLFNGGPGASSSPLHMSALGPAIRIEGLEAAKAPLPWRENPYSPLDTVDLVFIDPVGTGFSRVLPGADGKPYFNVPGDAKAVTEVIERWLKTNGREASPRYLAGESYGTIRAAAIAGAKTLRLDGVLLIALAANESGREMPYVASLPTMAAGAWYHKKIDRRGRTVDQVFEEALKFARGEYVTALIQGSSLPAAERKRVAQRMSQLIGLPAAFIEERDLRVSKNDYMFNLLKDQNLRTGLLDVEVTAPLAPGQDGAIDDPALGVIPSAPAPGQAPKSPAEIGPVPSPQVGRYVTEVLKFPTTDPYYGVNFSVNAAWDYEGRRVNPLDGLAKAMREDPKLRLFWAAGYYDLTTPAYSGRYALDQVGVPPAQLNALYFPGPHGVYAGEVNLKRFTGAVRDFVKR